MRLFAALSLATAALAWIPAATAAAAGPAQRAVVLQPVANLYSGPSEDTDVVSQAILGSPLELVEKRPGWAKVRTPDDYTGWMRQQAYRALTPPQPDYASRGTVAQVESLFAALYREPDVTRHQPVLMVPFEARLEVVAEPADDRRWLEVRLPDQRSAWVQRGDISTAVRALSIEETIALARRFLGLPYVWGGTSAFGYDCSGYMQMLYRRRGVPLPRDAGPQAEAAVLDPVDKSALQPGDLLYFGSSEKKITHTGLYIGNGEFIHATTYEHPVVQISRLADAHWAGLLVACRRPK